MSGMMVGMQGGGRREVEGGRWKEGGGRREVERCGRREVGGGKGER